MKTIKLLLIIGIIAFNLTTAFTQTHVNREWMTEFGYPDTLAWSKTIPFDNKLLHVGNSLDANQNVEMLITLTDLEGNIEWQENYSETSNSNDYGVAIDFDDFGNVYVVGTTDKGGLDQDIVLLKYNDSGQLQWSFTYDSPYGLDDVGTDLTLDGDGMIYVCGASEGSTTDLDYVTFCHHTSNEFVWVERYNHADLIDVPIGIEYLASTGEVTVTGASASSSSRWDYAFVSYNSSNGNLTNITRQTLSSIGYDMPTDVVTHHEGNIYVTGRSSNDGINYDIRTVKLDSAYNIIWSEKFDFQGGFDIGHAIEVDSSANVYVGGSVTRANNVEEMILIKYDKTGSELWHHVQASEDFTQPAYVKDITVSAHGDLYFLGEEFSNENLSRLVIGKIDSTGKTRWQRRTNQGNHEHPISIQWYNDTVLYTNSALEIGGGEHVYKTRKYAQFTQDASITYVQDTIPAFKTNELILRFKNDAVNSDAIDNLLGKKTEFGSLDYYLTSQAMSEIDQAFLDSRLCSPDGSDHNICEFTAIKIFRQLTSDYTTTTSRMGETIRIPDFWTSFLISFPEHLDIKDVYNVFNGLDDVIAYVELNYIVSLNYDPYYTDQHSLETNSFIDDPSINMEEAWDVIPSGGRRDIKCGVIDSGIEFLHEDFGSDGVDPNSSKKIEGWNFYSNSNIKIDTIPDLIGHGTSVSGIIGAIRNNNTGIKGVAGGNDMGLADFSDKGISLYALKTLENIDSSAIQWFYDAIVMSAIDDSTLDYAYGIHLSNNSYGVDPVTQQSMDFVSDTLINMFKEAVHFANRAKVIFVAARGNRGYDNMEYPAVIDDDWVLSVGGTGTDGLWKDFFENGASEFAASYGSDVDVAAPADLSLIFTTSNQFNDPLNFYDHFDGTSAAAPHVSGIVGLLMSYINDSISSYKNLAPEDCERIIELTADNIDNEGQYDDFVGWGKVNAGAAMRLVEKPYNTVHHFGSNPQFTHNTNYQLESLNETIYFKEPVQDTNNQWYHKGYHDVNVYKIESTVYHQIDPIDTIVAFWARPSSSTVMEPVINDSLLPRERVYIDYLDRDSAVLHGYVYEILDDFGTPIGWLPRDTTLNSELWLEYTILSRDSTAPVAQINEQTINNSLNLYPNPSGNNHTIELSDFENQNILITLYDIQGRKIRTVFNKKIFDKTHNIELNISDLNKGIYLYDVRTGNNRYTLRFLKY